MKSIKCRVKMQHLGFNTFAAWTVSAWLVDPVLVQLRLQRGVPWVRLGRHRHQQQRRRLQPAQPVCPRARYSALPAKGSFKQKFSATLNGCGSSIKSSDIFFKSSFIYIHLNQLFSEFAPGGVYRGGFWRRYCTTYTWRPRCYTYS